MWYGGTLTSAASSSSAPMNSTVPMTYDVRCRCRSTAAFGSPVVPLVNSRMAISSGSASGCVVDRLDRGDLVEEVASQHQLDTVDRSHPTRHRVVDDDDRRGGTSEDRPQLVVVEAVVDRDEGHAGVAAAEGQRRHDVGADVDQADPLDTALARPRPDAAGAVDQLGVGQPARATGPVRGAVAERVGGHLEQHRQVHQILRVCASPSSVRRRQRLGVLLATARRRRPTTSRRPPSCTAPRARALRRRSACRSACPRCTPRRPRRSERSRPWAPSGTRHNAGRPRPPAP